MNRDEFIKAAALSGYGNVGAADRYTNDNPKAEYTDDDFIQLYHTSMHWEGVKADKGLRKISGCNGKTTAFSNGVAGNSGERQDWGI